MALINEFVEYIRSILHYDAETGLFTWKVNRLRARIGNVAGTMNRRLGYVVLNIDGKVYYLHRLVWVWLYGHWPAGEIDHINGNAADNRLCNLRDVSHSQNLCNQKLSEVNSSGVKGVSWCNRDQKWRVQVAKNGKNVVDKYFDNFELAELVAEEGRELYHGEFARSA